MKTKKEVKKYIESQEWYNEFKEELMKAKKMNLDEYLDLIWVNEISSEIVLSCAFLWINPKWKEINKRYLDWLNS